MGKVYRAISREGSLVLSFIDSTSIVQKMQEYHDTSPLVSVAAGQFLTAASLMGSMLKDQDDSVTLRIQGDGPLSPTVAVSDAFGTSRISLKENNLPILEGETSYNVSRAFGSEGILSVIKDVGLPEPMVGQVALESGEIGKEISSYYALSEQVPTIAAVGVQLGEEGTIEKAGGYLVQLLPGVLEEEIDLLEKDLKTMPSATELLPVVTSEGLFQKLLPSFELDILDEFHPEYRCNCSREKIEGALAALGRSELEKLRDEQETIEVCCEFCPNRYYYDQKDLDNILRQSK